MREIKSHETHEVGGADLILTDFDEPAIALEDPEFGNAKPYGRYSFPLDPQDRR